MRRTMMPGLLVVLAVLAFTARWPAADVVIAAMLLLSALIDLPQHIHVGPTTGQGLETVALVAVNVLALIALTREVADYYARQMTVYRPTLNQWTNRDEFRRVEIERDFTYSALWMTYGAMLMVVGFLRRSAFVRWQALLLIAATIGKVFIYDVSELDRGYRIVSFIVLGVLLLAISFVYQRDWLQLSSRNRAPAEGKSTLA